MKCSGAIIIPRAGTTGTGGRAWSSRKATPNLPVASSMFVLMRPSLPSRAMWLKPRRRTRWFRRKVTAVVAVAVASSSSAIVVGAMSGRGHRPPAASERVSERAPNA